MLRNGPLISHAAEDSMSDAVRSVGELTTELSRIGSHRTETRRDLVADDLLGRRTMTEDNRRTFGARAIVTSASLAWTGCSRVIEVAPRLETRDGSVGAGGEGGGGGGGGGRGAGGKDGGVEDGGVTT